MDGQLANQIGLAALIPLVIEWMKRTNLPGLAWITVSGGVAARVLNIIAATAASVGINIAWEGSIWSGGTLTAAGVSLGALVALVWEIAKQLGLQEVIYRGAIKGK